MIQGYRVENGRLKLVEAPLEVIDDIVWLDLHNPTLEEEAEVEATLRIEVPTRAEMEEIEDSSRLYTENGAAFMTASLPSRVETDEPVLAPVTFILAGDRLITLRYHEPRAFRNFAVRAERIDLNCSDGHATLLSLLEVVVDRLADILEKIGREIEFLSRSVFRRNTGAPGKGTDFQDILQKIGRLGELVSNVSDSLVNLERVFVFLSASTAARPAGKEGRLRLKTLGRDTHFLTEHAATLTQKLNFLLDATLGMISIEQNAIIKIFSVAAVVFLPPTLIASIYGMNFDIMPELHWLAGYPFAIGLMIGSAVFSYWFFKSRGWL